MTRWRIFADDTCVLDMQAGPGITTSVQNIARVPEPAAAPPPLFEGQQGFSPAPEKPLCPIHHVSHYVPGGTSTKTGTAKKYNAFFGCDERSCTWKGEVPAGWRG